ncbi:MAG TPA: mannitol dehydrogenase family protein [Casimicrobiaceae bacterium]|nr:mannitol dehydrogenase family protein [Casimicrobiaceae bacterium]
MARLDSTTLAGLAPALARPRYDRAAARIGIVHLGLGAFHRAHQAVYTDDALAAQAGDWAIAGVSLRSADVRERLAPQDGLYTSIEKSPAGTHRRVIGSVREALFLGDERARIHALLAAPQTRIVTLTVTEKGYCHDPATGRLNVQHPEIAHDLMHPDSPISVVGLLVHALERRRTTHGAPLTILCCDNLPQNGGLLEGLVVNLANERDAALAAWIGEHAAFPSTMVDRIVPATTESDIDENDAALGVTDRSPVVHEPYIQWVIEDRFATPRPAWEAGGAQFVREVEPFEKMKLRLLNATHSAFAYLGYLAGYQYIYQVATQPDFVRYMRRFMAEEVTPTLQVPAGVDLAAYRDALVTRFANPALPHRTQQIAMDGSQKLPQRILATVRENLAAGRPVPLATLAVAGWMRYVAGVDEAGRPIKVSDPLAARCAAIAQGAQGDPQALARGLLGLREIFDEDLHNEPRFVEPVARWLAQLYDKGTAATVSAAVAQAA